MPLGDGAVSEPPGRGSQTILNEAWPQTDQHGGRHARDIPNQPKHIPVTVRLVFEHDGETTLPGSAARWTRTHVYVTSINDRRVLNHAVWVLATDVRRRPA